MPNDEYKLYKKKIKRNKHIIFISQLLILLLFFIIWQELANLKLINTFITSSPINIINSIKSLFLKNILFNNIFTTLYETLISFFLSSLIGIIIASLLWWKPTVAKIFDPFLTVINSLPKVALGPIIIIWVGANTYSIIIMALLISTFIVIMNTYHCFNNTNTSMINLLKSFNANKLQIFIKLVFPCNIKNIVNILKVNISMCLIGVIMGELLVSKEGIGYLIMYGTQVFNLNLVISSIILLCILASCLYYFILYIEKKVTK